MVTTSTVAEASQAGGIVVTFVIKLRTFSLAFDHRRRKSWDAPTPQERWRSPPSLGNWTWYAVLLLTHVPDLPHSDNKPVGSTGGVVLFMVERPHEYFRGAVDDCANDA
jgi:hypothetical protein